MISEGLQQTTQWFHDAVDVQARRIERLENSLLFYRAGFWALLVILVAFVIGAVTEGW
jgi:hypothetical protein